MKLTCKHILHLCGAQRHLFLADILRVQSDTFALFIRVPFIGNNRPLTPNRMFISFSISQMRSDALPHRLSNNRDLRKIKLQRHLENFRKCKQLSFSGAIDMDTIHHNSIRNNTQWNVMNVYEHKHGCIWL